MEHHRFHARVVRFRLRPCQKIIDPQRASSCARGQICAADRFLHLRKTVMFVSVHMGCGRDGKIHAIRSLPRDGSYLRMDAVAFKRGKCGKHRFPAGREINQRGCRHIAADAGGCIKDNRLFHLFVSLTVLLLHGNG